MESRIHDDSPTWTQMSTAPSAALRWLGDQAGRATVVRVLQAREDGEHLPVVAIGERPGSFRTPVTQATEVRLLFDVVTALPFPAPFAYVIPVVFDDPREPYWSLEIFPLQRVSDGGADMRPLQDARARAMRDLFGCFCSAGRCGFVITQPSGAVTKSQMIVFDDQARTRLEEIRQVLDFIATADHEQSQATCELAAKVFQTTFFHHVVGPDGRAVPIPRPRSQKFFRASVFPMMLDSNRLTDRRAVHARGAEPAADMDLFISHAHADSAAVSALRRWLAGLWPDLRVVQTEQGDDRSYRNNPSYFFMLARRARCLLYVATPASMTRMMVDTELGSCADKPIVSLLLGGVSLADLRRKNDESLFLALDPALMVDGETPGSWGRLMELLAGTLGRPRVAVSDSPVLPALAGTPPERLLGAYTHDWFSIASNVYGVRDRDQAHRLLVTQLVAEMTSAGADAARCRELVQREQPAFNLLMLLTARDPATWPDILELFPSLLDDELLTHAQRFCDPLLHDAHSMTCDLAALRRSVERAVVEDATLPLVRWVFERGERFIETLGAHPRLLEYYDHVEVFGQRAEDFDFGFQQPVGDPPLAAARTVVPAGISAREWFIEGLSRRLIEAARRSDHASLVYASTDFHTGRLAGLAGSRWIEAQERNPDRGMRGLGRYLQPCYAELLRWEIEALLRASDEVGRVTLVFPLVRLPSELVAGVQVAVAAGLRFDAIGLVAESPSNVIGIADFVAAVAPTLREIGSPLAIVLDRAAIQAAAGLPAGDDTSQGSAILLTMMTTLVDQALQAGETAGVTIRLGMRAGELDLLRGADARTALWLARRLSFLLEDQHDNPL